MPSWTEVREYARSQYTLMEDSDQMLKLAFTFEGEDGDERMQAIIVSRFEAMGREWCDFRSACCEVAQMDPAIALEKNAEFALGALQISDGLYIFRYSTQLETMDVEEFEIPLRMIARTADEIEREFAGGDQF